MQERVVKDSEQMVPRTRSSLEDAVTALEDLTVRRPQHTVRLVLNNRAL